MMAPEAWKFPLLVFGYSLQDVVREFSDVPRDLDVVELWSGVESVVNAARRLGLRAQPFDLAREPGVTDVQGPSSWQMRRGS